MGSSQEISSQRIQVRKRVAMNETNKKLHWKEKRKLKQVEKQKEEEEHRMEGLVSSIPSSNIGFKMLQQMGYTPGVALGKHAQGTLEPVKIELKHSRSGLGRDALEREVASKKARKLAIELEKRSTRENELRTEFQERRRNFWQTQKITRDYRKACTTLAQLEESIKLPLSPAENVDNSLLEVTKDEKQEEPEEDTAEENEEEEVTAEDLLEILERLRSQFHYCLYCGYQYESAETLATCCPGLEEDVH
ncbi:hypothetical protein O6H91_Y106300 [Diphasiastrum complanatum]|nr:hypothetical protein O6H91_Y106300 [Diphasiastrum complanatum]